MVNEASINILDMLDTAEKALENGEAVQEDIFEKLQQIFRHVLSRSDCPCGSGKQFFECCRARWLPIQRGQKKIGQEQREARKDTVRNDNSHKGTPMEGLTPVCMVAISKEGQPVVHPANPNADPLNVAQILLMAYNTLLTDTLRESFKVAQGALNGSPQAPQGPIVKP